MKNLLEQHDIKKNSGIPQLFSSSQRMTLKFATQHLNTSRYTNCNFCF